MTIEEFLLARSYENGLRMGELIRIAVEFHKNWPVLVETEPEFDMMPDSFDTVKYKLVQRMQWLTQEEYRKKFGSAPPTAPLLRQWANLFSDHADFDEAWRTEEPRRPNSPPPNHSCSCHVKNAGACPICKELGCEVWDFNQVAVFGDDEPKPEKPEGDDPRSGHKIPPLM